MIAKLRHLLGGATGDDDNHARTLAGGTLVSLSGLVIVQACNLVLLLMKTRLMQADDVGLLALGTSLLTVTYVVVAGFPVAMLRFAAHARGAAASETDAHQKMRGILRSVYRCTLPLGLLLLGLVHAIAGPVARGVFHAPSLTPVLCILAYGFMANAVTQVHVAVLKSTYKVIYQYAAEAGVVLLTITFVAAGHMTAHRLVLFASAFAAANGLVAAWTLIVLWRRMPFLFARTGECREPLGTVFRFGMTSSLAALVGRVRVQVVLFIIALFVAPAQLALYNVAFRLGTLPNLPRTGLSAIFPALVANLYGRNRAGTARSLHYRASAVLFPIGILGFLFFLGFGRPILSWFGPFYREAYVPLLIVAAASIVTSGVAVALSALTMTGRPHLHTLYEAISLGAVTVLCHLLIPRFGITGAAIAYAVSQVSVNLAAFIHVSLLYRKDSRKEPA